MKDQGKSRRWKGKKSSEPKKSRGEEEKEEKRRRSWVQKEYKPSGMVVVAHQKSLIAFAGAFSFEHAGGRISVTIRIRYSQHVFIFK